MFFGWLKRRQFRFIKSSLLRKLPEGFARREHRQLVRAEDVKDFIVVNHNMIALPHRVELATNGDGRIAIVECLDSFERDDIPLYRPTTPSQIVLKIPASLVANHRSFWIKIT